MAPSLERFTIAVSDDVLQDLRERLLRTRWPDEIADSGWDYGTNLAYLKELVAYWLNEYDWRAHERALNALPHYRAEIDGLRVHFIHQPGNGPDPLPLIVTHGWPSTFYEMTKIIPLLADPGASGGDPSDAFHVVVPSLPGYGFSDRPTQRGMNVVRIADLFAQLMRDVLGYDRFGAQGGDWGAAVTARLGFAYPQNVVGIHLTMLIGRPTIAADEQLSEEEQTFLRQMERWRQEEAGYSMIQGTKPQTLAYGLNDSPAGLAGWIVEKFRSWSDCGGDVERRFTKDELLTNIMIYWVTQTINSSTRLYYEQRHNPWTLAAGERITVPTGVASFPGEIARAPRSWFERACNLQRWAEMASGGHFAAMEEPERLVEEIRAFFRPLRTAPTV